MNMTVNVERIFKASPEKLYEVWTSELHLSQWFGVQVDAEPKVGGSIRFHFGEAGGPVHGEFKVLKPYEYVSFSWTSLGGDKEPDTTVHITFKKQDQGTLVNLRHEGFTDQKAFDAHDEGWLSYIDLWSIKEDAGPQNAKKVAISETFQGKFDFVQALSTWFDKPANQFKISELPGNSGIVTSENFEFRFSPCRFGMSVSLCEWGFQDENLRLIARQKWIDRFAALKKGS